MISYCPQAAIPELVPVLEPLIAKPLARMKLESMYTVRDILDACLQGRMALWVAGEKHTLEGIAVTNMVAYPAGAKHLNLYLVGGTNMSAWFPDLFAEIQRYAVKYECNRIIGCGRPGWPRVMRRMGVECATEQSFIVEVGDNG